MLAGDLSPGQEASSGAAVRWLSATLEEEEEAAGEGGDDLRAEGVSDATASGRASEGGDSALESGDTQGWQGCSWSQRAVGM